jgi:hypothetical protein
MNVGGADGVLYLRLEVRRGFFSTHVADQTPGADESTGRL